MVTHCHAADPVSSKTRNEKNPKKSLALQGF